MSLCCCNTRRVCAVRALILSAIVGVLTTLLQITAVITLTPIFLWIAFGIAVGYLIILAAARTLRECRCAGSCREALDIVLAGILGTVLLALVLLAVGIVATSLVSAILVGILLFFLTLTLTGTVCYIQCLSDSPETA